MISRNMALNCGFRIKVFIFIISWFILSDAKVVNKEISIGKKSISDRINSSDAIIYYMYLDQSSIGDYLRFSVKLNSNRFTQYKESSYLYVDVTNARNSLTIKLPRKYHDMPIEYEAGNILNPLLEEDFQMISKQLLMITVRSEYPEVVSFDIHFKIYDRAQSRISLRTGKSEIYLKNQAFSHIKPLGFSFVPNVTEIDSLQIKAKGEDDICVKIVIIPNMFKIYNDNFQTSFSGIRTFHFNRRADVYITKDEVQKYRAFNIYFFVEDDQSKCFGGIETRNIIVKNKKIDVEFKHVPLNSLVLSIISLITFAVLPIALMVLPLMEKIRKIYQEHVATAEIIDYQESNIEPMPVTIEENETNVEEVNNNNSNLQPIKFADFPLAIFLPVLLQCGYEYFTYINSTNYDNICHFNYACSINVGNFRAFNNVITNVEYIFVGFYLFAIFIIRRKNKIHEFNEHQRSLNLVDLTIALFVIFQGFASSMYHLCPNEISYQFDTPCIEIISGLIVLKLHYTRTMDFRMSSTNYLYSTVFLLKLFVTIFSNSTWFKFYITCLLVIHFAYVLRIKRDSLKEAKRVKVVSMIFCSVNFIFFAIFNITDELIFAHQVTTYYIVVNCLVYLIYYAYMKVINKESISNIIWIYGIIGITFWTISLFFYMNSVTNSLATGAISRDLNKECLLFGFFDSHDLWHLFSACAIFFTVIFINDIDNKVAHMRQQDILIF